MTANENRLKRATDFLESYAQQFGTPETRRDMTRMLMAYETATRELIVNLLVSYERIVSEKD